MENSEILGFQFEPTKALQPDSSSGKSWEIFSSADSDLSIFRRNEASVDHLCHYVFQLQSNTNNEGVFLLTWIKHMWIFKNKEVVHLFTHNCTSFLYQTNQWIDYCKGSIVNLILIHNTKRRKVFFRFLLRLYLIRQSLHCILQIIYCIYYTLF